MIDDPNISEKERKRRLKISKARKKYIAKKREAGLRAYRRRRHKEKVEREKKEAAQKEKERQRKIKEREKAKHKRKPGRPRKPGVKIDWNLRKRKKRALEKKKRLAANKPKPLPFTYKIIICRNGIQKRFIGKYRTSQDAYEKFKQLKFESSMVVFPRITRIDKKIESSIDECILIQQTDAGPQMLRNEYGTLVEQRTNLDGWEVIDKFPYKVEETFWVWGHDNRSDRKDFNWIFDNLIRWEEHSPYEFKRVSLYKNKIVIKYDDGSLQMVICKTDSDSIFLYNEMLAKCKREKIKNILFLGDKEETPEEKSNMERDIMALTGWDKKRVNMNNTTYFKVN